MTTFKTAICLSTVAALGISASLLAHADDPKAKNRLPPYAGPGYRAALGGAAAIGFPADGVQLLAWLPVGDFGSQSSASDCWGYTSPTGREYAMIGLSGGTGFVDITNPSNPNIINTLAGPGSTWRDVKVYEDHAYSVSEGGDGIQVFDLSQIDSGFVSLVGTVTTGGTTASHNVAIDETSGFLYRAGGGSSGIRIYSLQNKDVPALVGQWNTRYCHDVQVVTYTSGPYAGRQIAFLCSGFNGGSVETGLDILDVTDKSNIIELSRIIYPNGAYSHQAWLTEDRQYLYLNDELDENGSLPTTTFIFNVSDIDNPFLVDTFTNGSPAIGHNLYTKGNLIYEANYRSGLRVFDASDPENPSEIAYFDTWEADDNASFNGLWSCFPYFDSGTVIGSDIEKGLFVWSVSEPLLEYSFPSGLPEFIAPSGGVVQIQITELEAGALVPGSATLHYSTGESFSTTPLVNVGGDVWEGTIPSTNCPSFVDYYFTAQNSGGVTQASPANAPGSSYTATVALGLDVIFEDDMETDAGWSVENIELTDGAWDRGIPAGGDVVPGDRGDPPADADGSGQCWLTDNAAGNSDLDGGPTRLTSPVIDVSATPDPFISYARWFTNDDGDIDRLDVEISNDNGATWTLVESVGGSFGWQEHTFRVTDFVAVSSQIRMRFSATDNPNDSVTEAGIDALRVIGYDCDSPGVPGDVDGDGDADFQDLLLLLANWGDCPVPPAECPADFDTNGSTDFQDLLFLLANWTG